MEIEAKEIQVFERILPLAEYVGEYRDVPRFEGLCRACPNFGTRWGCPPFDDNPQPSLDDFDEVLLVLVKINLEDSKARTQKEMVGAVRRLVQRVRPEFERKLLDIERETEGRAALFTGMCPHCDSDDCARVKGHPCRHPSLVRPSLEALGFDLQRTVSDIFDTRILWVKNEKAPAYLCLVGAVFRKNLV